MADIQNQGGSNPADKRTSVRIPVNIPVQISVLMPELTFSPTLNSATILNLSENGAKLEASLPAEIYTSLLQKVRYCRVDISEPEDLACRVTGRAVWIQPRTRGGQTVCHIGLYFEDVPAEILTRIRSFLERSAAEAQAKR